MVAPPAMSTFFPYTTLFRSERAAAEKLALQPAGHASSPSSVEMDTWVETSSDTRKEPAEPNVQPGNETRSHWVAAAAAESPAATLSTFELPIEREAAVIVPAQAPLSEAGDP